MSGRKELKDELRLKIGQAFEGKLVWLDKIIVARGYFGRLDKLQARHISRLFGITAQAVGLWVRRDGCPRNADKTYNFYDVLAWRIQQEAERAADKRVSAAGGDPLLMGEATDALDQYRRVKTRQAEFDLAVRKKEYYSKYEVDRNWMELGRQVGATITELEKRFPEAAELLRLRVNAFTFEEKEDAG